MENIFKFFRFCCRLLTLILTLFLNFVSSQCCSPLKQMEFGVSQHLKYQISSHILYLSISVAVVLIIMSFIINFFSSLFTVIVSLSLSLTNWQIYFFFCIKNIFVHDIVIRRIKNEEQKRQQQRGSRNKNFMCQKNIFFSLFLFHVRWLSSTTTVNIILGSRITITRLHVRYSTTKKSWLRDDQHTTWAAVKNFKFLMVINFWQILSVYLHRIRSKKNDKIYDSKAPSM